MGLNLKSKLLYKALKFMMEKEYGKNPFIDARAYQENMMLGEITRQANTYYGRKYNFGSIHSIDSFQKNVPLTKIEDYLPYYQRMQQGETNLVIADELIAWCLTSGTTSTPKMIPYTNVMDKKLGMAIVSLYKNYIDENPRENIRCLSGKFLSLVADSEVSRVNGLPVGYVSGIALANKSKSKFGGSMFTPSFDVFAEQDWDTKYWRTSQQAVNQNVSMMVGVPAYIQDYLLKLDTDHKYRLGMGDKTIPEIWPNLQLVIWGGAKLESYIGALSRHLGDSVDYRETYGGTESGLVGFKVDNNPGMLPSLGNNFYEFIPMNEWRAMEAEGGDYQNFEFSFRTYDNVKANTEYAIVITNIGGMYRYIWGDIVTFHKGDPFRIDWAGRLNWYSNIAVERMTFSAVQNSVTELGEILGCRIPHFSYATNFEPPQYQFVIETDSDIHSDLNLDTVLDQLLGANNVEYKFCRERSLIEAPMVITVPAGTYNRLEKHQLSLRGDKKGHYKAPRFTSTETIQLIKSVAIPCI